MDTKVPPTQLVFKRREIKYLLDASQRDSMDELLTKHMAPDAYGESMVTSIYFDTPTFLLSRRSIEGGSYKEKLRVRGYGPITADTNAFVEIKKKCNGIVYKRRVGVKADGSLAALTTGHVGALSRTPGSDSSRVDDQILHEIDFLLKRYRGIAPAFCITYLRTAFFAKGESDLRMTFDTDIRWYACGPDGGRSWTEGLTTPQGSPLLEPGQALLEVKSARAMPLWLTNRFDSQRIHPTSFSKVGHAFLEGEAARLAPAARHLAALPTITTEPSDHSTNTKGSLLYA